MYKRQYLDNVLINNKEKIDNLVSFNSESDRTESTTQNRDILIYLQGEDPYHEIYESINERAKQLIVKYFNNGIDDLFLSPMRNIHVLYPPFSLQEHSDNQEPETKYGVVVYLSSPEDYTGGDLYYTKLDKRLRPERGSIVIHPASSEYSHTVEQVLTGIRLNISMFAKSGQLVLF